MTPYIISTRLILITTVWKCASGREILKRLSDPNAHHDMFYGLPIPIGIPQEASNDIIGLPLSKAEFDLPPLFVDPPMESYSSIDPTERAGLYEGDIIVESIDRFFTLPNMNIGSSVRNALTDKSKLWPNAVVPYVLSSSFNKYDRGRIAVAMKELHDNSCIRFVPRKNESEYVHVLKGDGCASSVGRVGGKQVVSLGAGCMKKGIVIHELMHSLGFWHEQSRPDRDKFISIIWSNVLPDKKGNFGKFQWDTIQNLTVSYDLGSIMHYASNAFAKNRQMPTIVPKNNFKIGQRFGLSKRDKEKIGKLYNCLQDQNQIGSNNGLNAETVDESHCKYWAMNGECQTNASYMEKHCSKQCKTAADASLGYTLCSDTNPNCEAWSNQQQCTENPPYMHIYCSKSCKKC